MSEINVQQYNKLRAGVLKILSAGKERAPLAVEAERVRTYWEVGRLVDEYLSLGEGKPAPGDSVVPRLAGEIEMRPRIVYEMLDLFRKFKEVPPGALSVPITWSHYRRLLPISKPVERQYYLSQVTERGWSVRQLEAAIKEQVYRAEQSRAPRAKDAKSAKGNQEQGWGEDQNQEPGWGVEAAKGMRAKRGKPHTYRVADLGDGELVLDLGFTTYRVPDEALPAGCCEGDRVISTKSADSVAAYHLEKIGGLRGKTFTYKAQVTRVVDGDTVWVKIDLGFRVLTRQKLRFRGIDAPELGTRRGQAAKAFVERTIGKLPWVVVTTTREDKYGRYLADVFYPESGEAPRAKNAKDAEVSHRHGREQETELPRADAVAEKGRWLNRDIVEAGYAQVV